MDAWYNVVDMSTGEPKEQNSSFFGRVEETVVENDPAIGYTKTRTVMLDNGYENLIEKFEGDVFDTRNLTIVPEEGIKRVELKRVYKDIEIGLSEVDNGITLAFYLHDPVKVFEGAEGERVLRAFYNSEGALDYLQVYSLPRSSKEQITEQNKGDAARFQGEDSTLEEIWERALGKTPESAFMEEFAQDEFSYSEDTEGQQQQTKYGEEFNLLERGFKVNQSSNFITVHQRLLTMGANITAYSATVPLSISVNEAVSRLHDKGKTWRNFLDEIGIKANSA